MEPTKTEIVVLGAGPGGYAAAFYAADLGKKVTLIERDPKLGGVCLNRGCIPSKALLHAAHTINAAKESAHRGIIFGPPQLDLNQLRAWKNSIIGKLSGGITQLAQKRGVTVLQGRGSFVNSNTLRVETEAGSQVINYDHAGATEVGPWGVGDLAGRGLQVIEPCFHPEFLSVETGRAAGPGELAELVLTTLGRTGAPVIRYRTGDLVRPRWPTADDVAAGGSPWVVLEGGILGRTDDMLVVRGVNVFPGAIDDIVRSFPEVVEYRLTLTKNAGLDVLQLEIEDHLNAPDRVARELQLRLGLRVDVATVPLGSLPRFEGKGRRVIDRRLSPPRDARP